MASEEASVLSQYLQTKQAQWVAVMRQANPHQTQTNAEWTHAYLNHRTSRDLAQEFGQDNAFVAQKICSVLARTQDQTFIQEAIDLGAYVLDESIVGDGAVVVLQGLRRACQSRPAKAWTPLFVVGGFVLGLAWWSRSRRKHQ